MILPPFGLCLPCRYRRCRDGDTWEISLPLSDRRWAIRAVDIDCAERHTPQGKAAKLFAEAVLEDTQRLAVFVPAPPAEEDNLLSWLTFDRLPGVLYIDTGTTLSQMLLRKGLATRRKKAWQG